MLCSIRFYKGIADRFMKSLNRKNIGIYIAFAVLMVALGASDAMRGIYAITFKKHFELSAAGFSRIVAISYAGNLVFLFLGGWLSDKLKKKKAILIYLALWMLAELLFFFTDNYILLLVGFFIAMGASTLLNTTMNLTTAVVFATMPGFLVNLLYFTQGIGTSGSQGFLGSIALSIKTWHYTCLALCGIGLVSGLLLLFVKFPEEETVEAGEEKTAPWTELWKSGNFYFLILIMSLYFICEHSIMNWYTQYAVDGLKIEETKGAMYVSMFWGAMTVGRLLLSPLTDKLGAFRSIIISALLGGAFYIVSFLGGAHTLWMMVGSGLLLAIIYPTFVMFIPSLFKKELSHTAAGQIIAMASIVDIAFNAAFGYVIDGFGAKNAFYILPAIMGVWMLTMVLFGRKNKTNK